jgi:L-ascorbate metabolism protein UlaG (beta-lactamase superfamily)
VTSPNPARPLIRPALQGATFLADVAAARQASDLHSFQLWWLNQSGYLLHWAGHFLLLDPYLSDSLTRKYATTDKPHVRMTERVVDPAALTFVSAITSSHLHTDHLDPDTLKPLAAATDRWVLVGPEALRATLSERSGLPPSRILGLNAPLEAAAPGTTPGTATVGPWTFHAVPAAHETLAMDALGRLLCLGYVITFGPFRVYHSGDTIRYPGMEDRIRPHSPQIALLPINGRGPERRVSGNLWGHEAAQLAWDLGVQVAIPGHYDLFDFNTASPDEFVAACQRLGQGYRILRAGERSSFQAGELAG